MKKKIAMGVIFGVGVVIGVACALCADSTTTSSGIALKLALGASLVLIFSATKKSKKTE